MTGPYPPTGDELLEQRAGLGLCDGAGDDALESVPRTPQSRGWGPAGRPANRTADRRDRGRCPAQRAPRDGAAGRWLCDETVRRRYRLRSGRCLGFACRGIRDSSAPSNHSWGLAVDLHSLANPMGSRLVTDMPRWMPELWTGHGFAWGGAYTGRKDAMHYEYVGTPAELRRTIAALPDSERHAARDDDRGKTKDGDRHRARRPAHLEGR